MPLYSRLLVSLSCRSAKPRPTPTLFCFPGLESKPWHDASAFPALHQLELNRDAIQREYLALRDLRNASTASAASTASDYNVNDKEHQLHSGEWDWLSYVTQGRRQADFAAHCPKTVEVLESIPGFMTGLPFAYAFFSVLKPQVRPLTDVLASCEQAHDGLTTSCSCLHSRASKRTRRRATSVCGATSRSLCPVAAAFASATRRGSGRLGSPWSLTVRPACASRRRELARR